MSEENEEESSIRQYLDRRPEALKNFESRDYLIGVLSILLLASFSVNLFQYQQSSLNQIEPVKAGEITVKTVNENILFSSPNNVSASLVNVTDADQFDLENFYRVRMNVTNPAGSQITSVYTKKDGSIVFLQLPRRLGEDFQKGRYH